MNVIISNEAKELSNLDIDIIKTLTGTYEAKEINEMFKSFFYSKMILDVTSLNNYTNISTYEELIKSLDVDKIIFYLPPKPEITNSFLAQLVSVGIYNFTTNIDGVKHLLKKSNTLKDVEYLLNEENEKMEEVVDEKVDLLSTNSNITPSFSKHLVIGFKNVTEHAGATTFIYILKKTLTNYYGKDNVVAIEVDKEDFKLFNDNNMISIKQAQLSQTLNKLNDKKIILLDLNSYNDDTFTDEVYYLIEPTTIKLNKLIKFNRDLLNKIKTKKIILNQSLLSDRDVLDFESEAKVKIFYNIPQIDERKKNDIIIDFLTKAGFINQKSVNKDNNKIFGLFRR